MVDGISKRRFNFKKKERLRSKKKIAELFLKGSYLYHKPFTIKYLADDHNKCFKILVIVPKKQQKKAVDRNLLKRRIREAYRKNKFLLEKTRFYYNIAVIYNSGDLMPFHEIQEKLIILLSRFQREVSDSAHE